MQPLSGRKIWFGGIGGAGMSGYAQLAQAWGAEVAGWDPVDSPYLEPLHDMEIQVGGEPAVPAGWEVVVSSAYPEIPGTSRQEFLRELVAFRRSIVVGGSHGKGTTSAMIAFVLRETGRDPAWLIGAPVPQLGSNAGAGEGWLVVEGDEYDRTVFTLPAEIAVITTISFDHHSEYRSLAELQEAFAEWAARAPMMVQEAGRYDGELAVPGEHNRRNAGTALAALALAGVPHDEAAAALARFTGTSRRFEVFEAGAVTVVDDYGHHPAEIASALAAMREKYPGRRLRVLFQPHLYSRTRHLARELAESLRGADDIAVADIYPAREEPVPGVTGKLVVEQLSDLGRTPAWTPTIEEGIEYLVVRARPGDVLATIGAGSIDRAPALLLERLNA